MQRGSNFELVTSFLTRNGLCFQTHPTDPVLFMTMGGANGTYSLLVICDDEAERFAGFSRAPIQVPAEKRCAVAEYLTRVNHGLMIGNFEMDYADGEVRYKTAMDTDGIRLTDPLLGVTIGVNCGMMDQYLPGLLAVVFGDEKPEQAVARARGAAGGPIPADIEAALERLFADPAGEETAEAPEAPADRDETPSPAERLRGWLRRYGR